jgi:hypothetical protein
MTGTLPLLHTNLPTAEDIFQLRPHQVGFVHSQPPIHGRGAETVVRSFGIPRQPMTVFQSGRAPFLSHLDCWQPITLSPFPPLMPRNSCSGIWLRVAGFSKNPVRLHLRHTQWH